MPCDSEFLSFLFKKFRKFFLRKRKTYQNLLKIKTQNLGRKSDVLSPKNIFIITKIALKIA